MSKSITIIPVFDCVRVILSLIVIGVLFFFFFSSRRRHTRSLCDWSSDVCSSDLLDRDIVLIDQRGTGGSNPLNCEPEDRDEEDFSKIDDYPVERLRTCLARLKANARFYTTAIAMDDIDEIGRASCRERVKCWDGE